MAEVLRGEIYWADLDPTRGHQQGGRRPVLVISHDVFNARSGTVIALAITVESQRVGYPLTWRLGDRLLPRDSWVKVSQIRTLPTERLGQRLGRLGPDQLNQILAGLWQLIG